MRTGFTQSVPARVSCHERRASRAQGSRVCRGGGRPLRARPRFDRSPQRGHAACCERGSNVRPQPAGATAASLLARSTIRRRSLSTPAQSSLPPQRACVAHNCSAIASTSHRVSLASRVGSRKSELASLMSCMAPPMKPGTAECSRAPSPGERIIAHARSHPLLGNFLYRTGGGPRALCPVASHPRIPHGTPHGTSPEDPCRGPRRTRCSSGCRERHSGAP